MDAQSSDLTIRCLLDRQAAVAGAIFAVTLAGIVLRPRRLNESVAAAAGAVGRAPDPTFLSPVQRPLVETLHGHFSPRSYRGASWWLVPGVEDTGLAGTLMAPCRPARFVVDHAPCPVLPLASDLQIP